MPVKMSWHFDVDIWKCILLSENQFYWFKIHWDLFLEVELAIIRTGSVDGLVPSLQQVITWANVNQDFRSRTDSLVNNVLTVNYAPAKGKAYFNLTLTQSWKAVRMTVLLFTEYVEDKLQCLQWIPGLSPWRLFRFCDHAYGMWKYKLLGSTTKLFEMFVWYLGCHIPSMKAYAFNVVQIA